MSDDLCLVICGFLIRVAYDDGASEIDSTVGSGWRGPGF